MCFAFCCAFCCALGLGPVLCCALGLGPVLCLVVCPGLCLVLWPGLGIVLCPVLWPGLAWAGLCAHVGMCRVVHGAPVQPRRCTELRGARITHSRKAPAQLQFCTETNEPRAQSLRVRARRRPNLASVRKYARLARKGRHALRNQALAPSGTLLRNLRRLSEGQYIYIYIYC